MLLPNGLEKAEISTDGGINWVPYAGGYAIGDLPTAAALSLQVRAQVSSFVTEALVNTAMVSSDTPDPNPANNQSTVTTPTLPSADLSIVKQSTPDVAVPGGTISYALRVVNAGPADAQQVTVRISFLRSLRA